MHDQPPQHQPGDETSPINFGLSLAQTARVPLKGKLNFVLLKTREGEERKAVPTVFFGGASPDIGPQVDGEGGR
jgi:hypothetical protein